MFDVTRSNSTNEEARRRALAGDPGRMWIVADEQTAGRGRRGRAWISLRGNLHASALLIDPCPAPIAPQLGFVAGVALARAARDIGAAEVGLKWPNDLLSNGAKCAGILVESAALASRGAAYVVGVGVNCAQAPEGLDYAAACLTRANGPAVSPGELFERLARSGSTRRLASGAPERRSRAFARRGSIAPSVLADPS